MRSLLLTIAFLSTTALHADALKSSDMGKILERAKYTLSTLSGVAASTLSEVTIRYENFNKVAHVTLRGYGTTVKYRCTKVSNGEIDCSAFRQPAVFDLVE